MTAAQIGPGPGYDPEVIEGWRLDAIWTLNEWYKFHTTRKLSESSLWDRILRAYHGQFFGCRHSVPSWQNLFRRLWCRILCLDDHCPLNQIAERMRENSITFSTYRDEVECLLFSHKLHGIGVPFGNVRDVPEVSIAISHAREYYAAWQTLVSDSLTKAT